MPATITKLDPPDPHDRFSHRVHRRASRCSRGPLRCLADRLAVTPAMAQSEDPGPPSTLQHYCPWHLCRPSIGQWSLRHRGLAGLGDRCSRRARKRSGRHSRLQTDQRQPVSKALDPVDVGVWRRPTGKECYAHVVTEAILVRFRIWRMWLPLTPFRGHNARGGRSDKTWSVSLVYVDSFFRPCTDIESRGRSPTFKRVGSALPGKRCDRAGRMFGAMICRTATSRPFQRQSKARRTYPLLLVG